jgi:prepilin-type N-terminal cleavage/methylation domain-containing protein/prepilin-type processing-associated H-X9-DG protein
MKHSDPKKNSSKIRPGFTLTELLVVILIIAVLATLAFFATNRARAMADKTNSMRGLRQLQIANLSYAADYSGRCVPIRANDENGNATRWFQDKEFLAYLTGRSNEDLAGSNPSPIPLDLLDPKVVRVRKPLYDKIYCSYGMNDSTLLLGGDPNIRSSHNLSQVSDPARSMVFATATDFRVAYNSRYKWDFEKPNDTKTSAGDLAYRHGDKILVVYFDGHVGETSKGELEAIDKKGGKNNAFWKPKP